MQTRRAFLLLAPALAAGLAACNGHGHDTGPKADEYVIDCETADGGVGVSDEDFQAFVNAEAAGQVMNAPPEKLSVLTAPAPGATLSIAAPPTFTFSPAMAEGGAVPRRQSKIDRHCRMPTKEEGRSRLFQLAQAIAADLVLERRAEAHCAPTSGEKYLLRLGSASEAAYTAMLSVTMFRPDAAKWSQALSGFRGQTLTMTVARAVFSGDLISDGPYVAALHRRSW